ncbi:MAG TPA: sigma-70 family RNA polymerase sigma factor [Microthrixaceae bacterium]|jgi:RNA polymerase sigma-B factor|nr:sigma-70 family RNA polymerase sigma factor [Microthrixaceae bacterium]
MQQQRRQRQDLAPEVLNDLIEGYQRTGERRLRNQVVEAHLFVADHHVSRFARSTGVSPDDLRQTAVLAMVRAVDRFDTSLGVSFRTFASRTIEGELKRYLRDRVWMVRPPRQAQERYLHVRRASEELTQVLGRTPTVREVANELDTPVVDVLDAMEAGQARNASGLDASGPDGEDRTSLTGRLGAVDPAFSDADERAVLRDAVSHLADRQQRVLHLRFVEELTQPQIADEVGLSQSYVSRILRGSIDQIRAELLAG